MKNDAIELNEVEKTITETGAQFSQLTDLELAYIGGGSGDTIAH
jgi:hypothetical protein